MDDSAAWLRLATAPGLGPVGQCRLLQAFGEPLAVCAASLAALPGVIGAQADALAGPEAVERAQAASAWLAEPGHELVTLADADYPQALLQLPDPPCVLFVEAALESGSLITGRLAGDLGREVFAVPGSIHSPLARGCHRLIREGAKLVETVQDVLEELSPVGSCAVTTAGAPAAPLPAGGDVVLAALGHDPCPLDVVCERSGLPGGSVLAILLELELAGAVAALAGGCYQRLG